MKKAKHKAIGHLNIIGLLYKSVGLFIASKLIQICVDGMLMSVIDQHKGNYSQ